MKESIHRRLSVNAIANLVRYGVYLGVSFLLTPFLVKKLGAQNYGLWVLVLSMLGYGGLLELGIQTAVVKLVAQLRAPGKERELHREEGEVLDEARAEPREERAEGVGALHKCI